MRKLDHWLQVGLICSFIILGASVIFSREMDVKKMRTRISELERTSSSTTALLYREGICENCFKAPPDIDLSALQPEPPISVLLASGYGPKVEQTGCFDQCMGSYYDYEEKTRNGNKTCRAECQNNFEMQQRITTDQAVQLLIDASKLKYQPASEETKKIEAKLIK